MAITALTVHSIPDDVLLECLLPLLTFRDTANFMCIALRHSANHALLYVCSGHQDPHGEFHLQTADEVEVSVTFADGKKHGKEIKWWTTHYKMNAMDALHTSVRVANLVDLSIKAPHIITHFRHGVRDGPMLRFNQFGDVISLCTMRNDKVHGLHRSFMYNHMMRKLLLIEDDTYDDGMLHGRHIKISKETGVVVEEWQYILGMKHGTAITRTFPYSNRIEDDYNHGTLIEQRTYNSNNVCTSITPMMNGKAHGICRTFYPRGETKSVFASFKGKHHGVSDQYYENGKQMSHMNYVHDELSGWFEHWNDDGLLRSREYYVDGSPFIQRKRKEPSTTSDIDKTDQTDDTNDTEEPIEVDEFDVDDMLQKAANAVSVDITTLVERERKKLRLE